ncbi:MAG: ABC-F family ATP-binding cassette domain-containing protein [Spirochaetes bacterium]|nr:MAG: ABC-F family ATP-binding cassette domain-containing protein [Spirochaetota bacterium]
MITVDNLSKSFGARMLFDGVSFSLGFRERAGLVGRNGHGKTTLFRIILGEEQADSGTVVIPRHYRVGHVSQVLTFSESSVIEEGCRGLPEAHRDEKWQVEKILSGLGFTAADMQKAPRELSGGFQVRLNLAKSLVSTPNLLLLDEPTNYLDITSIRWLARFLNQWQSELLLITHDRGFMDGVITHTIGLHRGKARKIAGGTDKFYTQIIKDEEIYEKTRVNDERRRKEIEVFISRFRAKARLGSLVQSRVKALEKQEKQNKLKKIKTLDFAFREAPFPGKYTLTAQGITFSYSGGEPWLINGFDLTIGRNDRVCVIGRNGRGKSTLLRLMTGDLAPAAGEVSLNPNTRMGYYAQTNMHVLRPTMTIEDEVLSVVPSGERQAARNICGAMLFEGDDALKKIAVLSGGEKSRVLLARILAAPANILILDEPTNHLDMESCDALLAALDNFDGAVVMVTHNEMFLHALATRIVAFQGGKAQVHEGTYQDFLGKIGWEEESAAADRDGSSSSEAALNRKELRRIRSDIVTRRSRTLKPLEKRIGALEEEIAAAETELAETNRLLIEASRLGEGARIQELSIRAHDLSSRAESLYADLDEATCRHEDETRRFDEELAALGDA